jgi:hypothetical protein
LKIINSSKSYPASLTLYVVPGFRFVKSLDRGTAGDPALAVPENSPETKGTIGLFQPSIDGSLDH